MYVVVLPFHFPYLATVIFRIEATESDIVKEIGEWTFFSEILVKKAQFALE